MKSGTTEHPKFKMLKTLLGVPDYVGVGILESLWMVAAQWKEHGRIGEWTNGMIASAIGWDGDADKLINALVQSGWLDNDPECRLMIHDWFDHCPHYMIDRINKRNQRKQKRDSVRRQSEDIPKTVRGQSENVAENRRQSRPIQSNPTQPNKPPTGVQGVDDHEVPVALNTPEFSEAWASWCKYRREIKKKMSPTTAFRQLKKLEAIGVESAIATINRSIEQGWTGLFPPDGTPANSNTETATLEFKSGDYTEEEKAAMEAAYADE